MLCEGQAERAQGVTLREHRGKGILPWALSELRNTAFSLGIPELLSVVARNNTPALRANQKAGGVAIGRIYRLISPPCFGFRQWVIRRDCKP
jgi:hypothetical protein